MTGFEYIKEMIENSCPKCSVIILGGDIKKHIENCKSTAIEDAVEVLTGEIDKRILGDISNYGFDHKKHTGIGRV